MIRGSDFALVLMLVFFCLIVVYAVLFIVFETDGYSVECLEGLASNFCDERGWVFSGVGMGYDVPVNRFMCWDENAAVYRGGSRMMTFRFTSDEMSGCLVKRGIW